MGAVVEYKFVSGVESAAPPLVGAPSAPNDVFVLGNQTKFTLVNSQVSAADVTSALWAKASYKAVYVLYTIFRSASGGSTRTETGMLMLVNDGTNWTVAPSIFAAAPNTTDGGITFSVTSSGQLQYVSDDNGGSYSSANSWLAWKVFDLVAA